MGGIRMEEMNLDELLGLTPAVILGRYVSDGAEKLLAAVEQQDQESVKKIIAKEKQLLEEITYLVFQ